MVREQVPERWLTNRLHERDFRRSISARNVGIPSSNEEDGGRSTFLSGVVMLRYIIRIP